jgi:hypothetical protein
MRYCCLSFFPSRHQRTKAEQSPILALDLKAEQRPILALDLDETLFFAKPNDKSLLEMIKDRNLAQSILQELEKNTSKRVQLRNIAVEIHFLHTDRLKNMFNRLDKENITLVFVTSGKWLPIETIKAINYALDVNLPLNTPFYTDISKKSHMLNQYYPNAKICLVDNDDYHLLGTLPFAANMTAIKAKHQQEFDTLHHIKKINEWVDNVTLAKKPTPHTRVKRSRSILRNHAVMSYGTLQ